MSRAAQRKIVKGQKSQLRLVPDVGSKRTKQSRELELLKSIEQEQEAQLEYQQNRRRFTECKPRNKNQATYLRYLKDSRLVFALGSAGTGKSFLATMHACQELGAGNIEKIVVTRPMVGCDEDIGFLPGTEEEKYVGWVGPIMEILEGYFGKKQVATYVKYGQIVMKPLMMMRGSTFRDSIVILDEAQNTTPGQMKMFLTRIGEGTRVSVNGDLEQSDLPKGQLNGLQDAVNKLRNSSHVSMVEFTEDDIVRDPLVREIIKAYRN